MKIFFDCSSLFRNGRVESGVPTYAFSVFELLKQTDHEIIPFYSGLKTYGLESIVGSFLHLPLPTRLIQILTFCGVSFDWLIEKFSYYCHCEERRMCCSGNSHQAISNFDHRQGKIASPVTYDVGTRNDKLFDIYFTPNVSTFYRYFSKRLKVVGVVHDLTHILFPEMKPWNERWRYFGQIKTHIVERLMFWNRQRKPVFERFDHFVAISEHTRRDLIEFARVPADKITVLYPTFDPTHFEGLFARIGEQEREEVVKTFSIRKPYLLFLGHIEPRKNVENLIRAFSVLKKEKTGLRLVIAGRLGFQFKTLLRLCGELSLSYSKPAKAEIQTTRNKQQKDLNAFQVSSFKFQDVMFTGHITDEEKYVLMQNAEVFVYPSLYEGFAYPCLEAMSVGTPVVTSPASALPEVLGDAALYADPWRPESMAAVVGEVLKDLELRTRMVQKGRECVKKYQNAESSLQQWKELFKKI